jgi:hypothetical protein
MGAIVAAKIGNKIVVSIEYNGTIDHVLNTIFYR